MWVNQPLINTRGDSPHAACLAALVHRGRALGVRVVAIPGARTTAHAADAVAAAAVVARTRAEDFQAVFAPVQEARLSCVGVIMARAVNGRSKRMVVECTI